MKQDSFQRNLMPLDSLTFVKLLHAVEKQYCVVSVPDLLLLINAYWVSTLTFHLLIIIQLILTFQLAADWTGQPCSWEAPALHSLNVLRGHCWKRSTSLLGSTLVFFHSSPPCPATVEVLWHAEVYSSHETPSEEGFLKQQVTESARAVSIPFNLLHRGCPLDDNPSELKHDITTGSQFFEANL